MYALVLKNNHNHEPAGSAIGGEFAKASGPARGPFSAWEQALQSATANVLQGQKDDGFEHAQVFGANGIVVVDAYGSRSSISFLPSELSMMRPGMTLVHNHPNGSSLSTADMLLATQRQLTVYAVTDAGNKYWSKGFIRDQSTSYAAFQRLSQRVQGTMQDALDKGLLTDRDRLVLQHVINLIAQKYGILDYHYSLTKETQAAYDANQSFYEGLISKE